MLIQDGIKFVHNFAGVISQSTPHLYLSGLPFLPCRSALANMLTANFPNIAQVARGQHEDWPSNQHVFRGHTSPVWSVAFSPDGRHIVSGSLDQTIRVWDAQTGAQVGNPLQGHTESVSSVAFLPDGRHIVSGSEDHTTQYWDAQTDSSSAHAGKFPTMHIHPHPAPFSPISMPTSMLSALPSAGDELTHMAEHSRHLGHGLFLLDNGWIVGSSNQLFLWVPPSYHPFSWYSPSTTVIIGRFPVLDFSNMVHGSAWDQCFCASSDST